MASILRVDTLTDASSNNSIAMSSNHNGTAKAMVIKADDAIALDDSFNVSSSSGLMMAQVITIQLFQVTW